MHCDIKRRLNFEAFWGIIFQSSFQALKNPLHSFKNWRKIHERTLNAFSGAWINLKQIVLLNIFSTSIFCSSSGISNHFCPVKSRIRTLDSSHLHEALELKTPLSPMEIDPNPTSDFSIYNRAPTWKGHTESPVRHVRKCWRAFSSEVDFNSKSDLEHLNRVNRSCQAPV